MRRPNGYASDRCDNAPYHDVAKKPQLASRGRVIAVLVWDAVIVLLTKLGQRGSHSHWVLVNQAVTVSDGKRVAVTFATLLLVALGSAACSNSLPQGPNGATPAGTYTLSLTTTLNGQTQTLNNFLTLVVK